MTPDIDFSPVSRFVGALTGDATPMQIGIQVAVAAAALGLGSLAATSVRKRVPSNPRWKFGEGGFDRVVFPLFMWLAVWLAKLALAPYQGVALLDIVLALITAFAAIRVAVYVLAHVLPEGAFLRSVIRAIAWAAWIAVALHLVGLLDETVDALDRAGVSFGQQRITLLLVLQALLALGLTLTIAMWASRITESRVLAAQSVEMSTRMVVVKLLRVVAIFLAILVALPMVGIDITALSVFSGALGVGLGFGLQKIASNYVSGFIVLLDRSLKIGDTVTVDNRRGEVQAIEARFTVLKGADGVESIIPNETLITQSVQHHTYSDPKVSIVIPVRVTFESDVDLACELLLEAASGQPRIIPDPAPSARVKALGDLGVEIELTVWVVDPAVGDGDLRSDILRRVVRDFRDRGVILARRDIRPHATAEIVETLD